MDQELTGIAGWAVDVMESLGGFGAFLLIGLENLFPPLPSEIILPLAGFTASLGTLGMVEMIVWCTAGSVTGAWLLYGVGYALGRDRTRAIMGALPLVNISDIDKTEAWFPQARHVDRAPGPHDPDLPFPDLDPRGRHEDEATDLHSPSPSLAP